MRINIRTKGIPTAQRAREWVERRLSFALGRFSHRVERVHVTLEDTNGPRGGVDMRCRVRVFVKGQGAPLIAEDMDPDLRAAIDRSAQRIGENLRRALQRAMRRPRARSAHDSFVGSPA